MITREEIIEKREESNRNSFLITLFSCLFFLVSQSIFAQDSIPAKQDLTEEVELKFQEFFFKALSEKAIGNHQKAIENLENCNQILPNNVTVFFEFSKNYLALNNTLLAKEYINRALEKEADNIWMLKHLVKIYQQENSIEQAIETQKKVVEINPKEQGFLVRLYLYDRDYDSALLLIKKLESEGNLSNYLKRIKKNLEERNNKNVAIVENEEGDFDTLINQFKSDKSFAILEKILNELEMENSDLLLKYSEEGMTLFPAQPLVYLANAKALNYQKNHEKALQILQSGIDFVIEEVMEANFYEEMAKAYKGLGNTDQEKKFLDKAKKLKI